ncbi:MAG TPA: methyltransferase domain-containing protein [Thermotogota bacterium]|nr:methyltransferase domain-containing protein [Thermotogota bacterium]HRW34761.1 methyltransferase domain-containing protein [Thermotogota bacterium]
MEYQQESVIIVDGYSTGVFYTPLLKKSGVSVIHVRSTPNDLKAPITQIADQALEKNASYYSMCLDGSQPLDLLCEQLKSTNPKAVIPGCETGVELADQLANRLGLACNGISLSHARRDKFKMYEACSKAGVPILDYGLFDSLESLQNWVEKKNKFPIVIKPARSAGADGLHFCHNGEQVSQAFMNIIDSTSMFGETNQAVIAQEFARGYEIVVNSVSCNGWHRISDLWKYAKTETADGHSVYDGVEIVEDFGKDTEAVLQYTRSILDALQITTGAAHTEIMVTENGPVLIECGARPMGGSFPQEIIHSCLGYTQLELSIDAYLSPDDFQTRWDYPYALKRYALFKFFSSPRKGALEAIPGATLLAGLPSVEGGNFIDCIETAQVDRTIDLLTSPAQIYLCHEDRTVVHEDFHLIQSLEREAQNLLFEMAPLDQGRNPQWFLELPDDVWLKPEENGKPDADIIWDALQLREGMEVLDCPCGDMRVGLHLAMRGVKLTGVDVNPSFIEKARKRFHDAGLTGELTISDMRDLHYNNQFDAIVNWFNSFGYFDIETDYYVLKLFHKSLRPQGLLLIEAPNRKNIIKNTRNIKQEDGHELIRRWDELTERLYAPVEISQNGKKTNVVIGTRMYSLTQYQLLFRIAGFDLVKVYDEQLNPFSDDSQRMIFIVRKA